MTNKLLVSINNLEDIMLKFQKTGIRDFSLFNEGEEQQKWYSLFFKSEDFARRISEKH